jgi:hypothetical protein
MSFPSELSEQTPEESRYIRISAYTSLGSPFIRDRLRHPKYAKDLFDFASQERCLTPLLKICKLGVAAGIRHYQQILLHFWCILVRRRIRHWRAAHTFAAVPAFVAGQDSLDVLVRRNPWRTPNASHEIRRAILETTTECCWDKVKPWAKYCVDACVPASHKALLDIAEHLAIWKQLRPFLDLLLLQDIRSAHVSNRILRILREQQYGIHELLHGQLQNALLQFLGERLTSKLVQNVLHVYQMTCLSPADLQHLVKQGKLERFVGRAGYDGVTKVFVDLYMNSNMCISMARSKDALSKALFTTKYMRTYYNRVVNRAQKKICKFIESSYLHIKERQHMRLERIQQHMHSFSTIAVRWRWRRSWLLKQSCIVCWESGLRLRVLHRDWRHAICQSCLCQIDNRCPLCRTSLARDRTISDASSVSYTSDYEDPYYDDDQMYHYD